MRKMIITGATGGIGRAVAQLAASRGWQLTLISRTASTLAADFPSAQLLSLDLAEPFELAESCDALVHCAGTCDVLPLAATSPAVLSRAFALHCIAFTQLVKCVRANGAAAAVSSVSATEGWAGGTAYCAAKGALSAAARALACELAPQQIRIKAFEPRYVLTPMFNACAGRMGVPASLAQAPAVLAEQILSWIEQA